jgi:outer membrane protein assembly factor BamB
MSNLGGIGGEEFSSNVCSDGAYGGVAYDPPYLYVPCVSSGIIALEVDLDASPSFSIVWASAGFFAGSPIVADGAVWTVNIQNLGQSGLLYALNPSDGTILFSAAIGSVGHFISPSPDKNMIFVGGNDSIWAFSVS